MWIDNALLGCGSIIKYWLKSPSTISPGLPIAGHYF